MNSIEPLELKHFKEMHALESMYYDEQFIAPAIEAYHWYQQYPNTTIALANDAGVIVGFINAFPIKKKVFTSIEAGTFNDAELTVEHIVGLGHPEPLYMFLSCIVVHPTYRRKGITQHLLEAVVNLYKPVAHRCVEIITDNVTRDGEHFSMKYGFNRVRTSDHSSVIYKQSYASFVQAVERLMQ
ncbi:MAG TPA: GNAT family N-acetyltransferase [Ureibacillus sp.]|nr:GNAT family N-acetyltransferase [Ureibacillus sp.]